MVAQWHTHPNRSRQIENVNEGVVTDGNFAMQLTHSIIDACGDAISKIS